MHVEKHFNLFTSRAMEVRDGSLTPPPLPPCCFASLSDLLCSTWTCGRKAFRSKGKKTCYETVDSGCRVHMSESVYSSHPVNVARRLTGRGHSKTIAVIGG